ncbi:hypothetical protein BDW22DRAFT_1326251, partial [Trametopsis cervina]
FRDGVVAAASQDGKYIMTSPNASFVPAPPFGRLSVSMKSNGKFGQEDPLEWPQVYVPEARYHFLCCIPRPSHPRRRPEVWAPLRFEDFHLHAPNLLQALYVLSSTRIEAMRDLVAQLEAEVSGLTIEGDTRHALDRLTIPATQRDLIRQFVCVERNYCMAVAWVIWHDLFANLAAPSAVPVVHNNLMGAFTTDPNVTQKLYHVGIPVWYMRHVTSLGSGDKIVNVVKVSPPTDLLSSSVNDHNVVVVYEGPPGIRHLEMICYRGHLYADIEAVPFPADYGPADSVTPSAPTPSGSSAPSAPSALPSTAGPERSSKQRERRAEPCTNVARAGRSKFKPFVHEALPPSLSIWEDALSRVDVSKVPANQPERRDRYVLNWLKIRDAWYYIMRDARYRRTLPTRWWRMFLDEGPYPQIGTGSAAKEKERSQVMQILDLVFDAQNIRKGDIQPTWFSRVVTRVDKRLCQEIAWEVSQLGFQIELLMLDLHFHKPESDPGLTAERVEWMKKVFDGGPPLHIPALPAAPAGLASPDPLLRAPALEAFRCLINTWPQVPDYIRNCRPLDTGHDRVFIRQMEREMAEFYINTFYKQAARAPVLPRRFPVDT